MRPVRLLATAAALLLFAAVPATASHGAKHPTFRGETVYFHCTGPTKVYQVNWLAALADPSSHVRWDTNPPRGSVANGEGCGGLDWGGTTNPLYDVAFQGTFTGNLRDVTVRLHQLVTHRARATGSETLRLGATIDGIPLFPEGAQPNHGRTVTVTPTSANSGATELYEFTITNIGYADEVLDENGNVVRVDAGGAAFEDGDGSFEHELVLFIGLHGTAFGQDPAGHKAAAWAWDTTEVPSGMVFNPAAPAAAEVQADLPQYG
ncbi:MAG: hypothetical protein M3245_04805 [Actinomycetota bacterium]|nr:hypothetical protein [Actinomycetota bacterium]